jgi:predicted Zn-dependent protease
VVVLAAAGFAAAGCAPGGGETEGEGPGHRAQVLALSPEQELELGRQAYREILSTADVLPDDQPEVRRVRRVGERIAQACEIRPLLREINIRRGYLFEWDFHVIESDRVNAFCLPGGKVAVFTGLLRVVEEDDDLATVIGHEMAHALAHHASERIARDVLAGEALRVAEGSLSLDRLAPSKRMRIMDLLSPGAALDSLAYNRAQESEADHIGVFLMAFAGYDPERAVSFWERMSDISRHRGRLPEILSDHPSDARRIAQLREWAPLAEGAKRAFDAGKIAPGADAE